MIDNIFTQHDGNVQSFRMQIDLRNRFGYVPGVYVSEEEVRKNIETLNSKGRTDAFKFYPVDGEIISSKFLEI